MLVCRIWMWSGCQCVTLSLLLSALSGLGLYSIGVGLQDPFLLMSFGFILKSLIGLYNKHWQLAWVNYCVQFCNKTITELFVSTARTDKKEKKIFLIYKEIQSGAVAKSFMRKGFLIFPNISQYMRRPLVIYDFATAPLWIPYIWGQFYFIFYQCSFRQASFVLFIFPFLFSSSRSHKLLC